MVIQETGHALVFGMILCQKVIDILLRRRAEALSFPGHAFE